MNACLWYPQSVDKLCRSFQSSKPQSKSNRSQTNGRSKADRIAHCLFFAVNQGGEFWNVIKKAADQVIADYDMPKDAQIFLRNMADRKFKGLKSIFSILTPYNIEI